jgi:conjugation system TraG family ATPase
MNITITSDLLNPIAEIGEGYIINKGLDYSIGFRMQLPLIHSLNDDGFDSIIEKMSLALNGLPPGIIVQRSDLFYPATPKLSLEERSKISYHDIRVMNGKAVMMNESYMFFTLLADKEQQKSLGNTLMHSLLYFAKTGKNKGLLTKKHYSDQEISVFLSAVRNFIATVESAVNGLRFYRLSKNQMIELICGRFRMLNLNNPVRLGEVPDISDHKDRVRIGDRYLNIISMLGDGLPPKVNSCKEDPSYSGANAVLAVSNLFDLGFNIDTPHIITQAIYTVDQESVYKNIERKRKIMKGAGSEASENHHNANNIELVQQEVQGAKSDKFVRLHFGIMLITEMDNESYYNDSLENIKSRLENMKIKYSLNNGNTLGYYYAYHPGNAADIADMDKCLVLSQHAATFGFYESNREMHATKGVLVSERKTGFPYELDFWEHPAINSRNMFIIGPTGTGKSVLMNHLVRSYLDHGDHVLLADVGGSYARLCKLYGGMNMVFSEENKVQFNPFLIVEKKADGSFGSIKAEDVEFITLLLYTAWQSANSKSKITSEDHATLSGTIMRYYEYLGENKDELPCFTGYYQFFRKSITTDSLYKDVSSTTFNRESFLLVMSRFIEKSKGYDGTEFQEGDLGYLFNCSVNPDIFNNRFVVFELDQIKDNVILFPITYYILTNVVLKRLMNAKKKGLRLYYIIDEAWVLLSGKYGDVSFFIEYAFRTFRKHGGSATLVTQGITDITNNEKIGIAVNDNCDIKIFKKQPADKKHLFQQAMNLSDHNLSLLYSQADKHKEFYISFKDEASVLKLNLSNYTLGVYTTKAEEVKWINEDLERTGSLEATLQNFEDFKESN